MDSWRAMQRRGLGPFGKSDWGRAGLMLAVALLSCFAGMLAADSKTFPYPLFERARSGLRYVLYTLKDSGKYSPFLFQPARSTAAGVVASDIAAMQPGLTALSWYDGPVLYLLDAHGRAVHRYNPKFERSDMRIFRRLFRETYGMMDRLDRLHLDRVRVLPNGDAILMVYGSGRRWDQSLGLVKVDRSSTILWRYYDGRIHHDFNVAPDGRIFALSRTVRKKAQEGLEYVPLPYVDDLVVILSPEGKVLDRISLFAAVRDSDRSFRSTTGKIVSLGHEDYRGDYLHTNNVDFITAEMARNFPHGEEGDLLISMRNLHAVGVLSMKRRAFSWITRGPWIAQHDPDILPNGNILLFDNLGGPKSRGRSRILELDPHTLGVVWRYEGTPREPFESIIRGSQQRLPNGNTLITESDAGRVFEVNRSGRIVWDLRSPFRTGPQGELIPVSRWAVRLDPDEFTPDFRRFLSRQTPESPVGKNGTTND